MPRRHNGGLSREWIAVCLCFVRSFTVSEEQEPFAIMVPERNCPPLFHKPQETQAAFANLLWAPVGILCNFNLRVRAVIIAVAQLLARW